VDHWALNMYVHVYLHYVMFYTDGIKMWKLSAQQTGNIIYKQTKSQTTNSQTTGSQTDSITPPLKLCFQVYNKN